jgi:hypothetical protein
MDCWSQQGDLQPIVNGAFEVTSVWGRPAKQTSGPDHNYSSAVETLVAPELFSEWVAYVQSRQVLVPIAGPYKTQSGAISQDFVNPSLGGAKTTLSSTDVVAAKDQGPLRPAQLFTACNSGEDVPAWFLPIPR